MGQGERGGAMGSLLTVVFCVALVGIVVAILLPVFFRGRPCAPTSDCQSNMKQIGSALKMYLSDWDDTYPTNRPYLRSGKLGQISDYVKLSAPGMTNADGTPRRFQHGTNWVEGLYSYVESVSKDGASTWRCICASERIAARGADTAAVTYAFNRNLIEQPEMVLRDASRLMEVRELDRLCNSELRPTNKSNKDPDTPPKDPFLTTYDSKQGATDARPHGSGSNILLADGHVAMFPATSMPDSKHITRTNSWDPKTKQWYNFGPGSGKPQVLWRGIAITP